MGYIRVNKSDLTAQEASLNAVGAKISDISSRLESARAAVNRCIKSNNTIAVRIRTAQLSISNDGHNILQLRSALATINDKYSSCENSLIGNQATLYGVELANTVDEIVSAEMLDNTYRNIQRFEELSNSAESIRDAELQNSHNDEAGGIPFVGTIAGFAEDVYSDLTDNMKTNIVESIQSFCADPSLDTFFNGVWNSTVVACWDTCVGLAGSLFDIENQLFDTGYTGEDFDGAIEVIEDYLIESCETVGNYIGTGIADAIIFVSDGVNAVCDWVAGWF